VLDPALIPVVAARFRALGEPGRLEILQAMQDGEKSVGELVNMTGRSQPNVSQHLGQLAQAGLVGARREGQRVFYRVIDPYLARICHAVCDSLAEQAREQSPRLRALEARALPAPADATPSTSKKAARARRPTARTRP
jgi:DNA-binding transcriptional ArsR family regulator